MLLNLESGAYAFTADPDEGEMTIGRENDCNFIVKEDGVSRHHCKIWFEGGQWRVEDSQSRHGTLVNNKQVQKPTALKNGDVLKVSNVNFMVSLHATNDHKEIGRALAGGAREKLKMLDTGPKAPAAKPTRMMKAPARKAKPTSFMEDEVPAEEPPAEEAPVQEEAPAEETAASTEPQTEPTDSESGAEEEAAAPPEKPTGAKLRPGVKGSATKSRTKGGKAPKDAPKKGGGMIKIIAAVVIFAGAGAAAYFALGNKPATETKSEDVKKAESKTEQPKEAVPDIPAKPEDTAKEAPKDAPAAPKADEKPANADPK